MTRRETGRQHIQDDMVNNPGVRTQQLREFTVRIFYRDDPDSTVGTGVVIYPEGYIITCRHVVEDAGIPDVHHPDGDGNGPATIGIYFPQLRASTADKVRRARISGVLPQHDDDIILLTLAEGYTPLGSEQMARLGDAAASIDHPFRSYGYTPIGDKPATRASGIILGDVEPPEHKRLLADPIQLSSQQIDKGMSGAAVLDTERNLVVGLISERYFTSDRVKQDVGYAVDNRVLTFDPFQLQLLAEDLPLAVAPAPKTDVAQIKEWAQLRPGVVFHAAPQPLADWVGRADLLKALNADWADPALRVTGLIGFGGEGKSSLARKWVDDLLNSPLPDLGEGPGVRAPTGIFWWGFYDRPSVEEFLEAALTFLAGEDVARKVTAANARVQIIAAMLTAGRYLFVLDGLEIVQHQQGDQYGALQSNDLRELLTYFAAPTHDSFGLITSRAPLLDLLDYTTYTHRDVTRLSQADGRDLLRGLGVQGGASALAAVITAWEEHALTLSLLGSYLAWQHGGDIRQADTFDPTPLSLPGRGVGGEGDNHYSHVHRILRRYDEHLTAAEHHFLMIFSAFRTPVARAAFDKVFGPQPPLTLPRGRRLLLPSLGGGLRGGSTY